MGTRLRTFVCIDSYITKPIYEGQVLEVFGDMFKMRGFISSPIKTYAQLGYGIHKWEETTNNL